MDPTINRRPQECAIKQNDVSVNAIFLTARLMGACLVFGIVWLIPQIGAGPVMIMLLAGQIIGGMVPSHFGWLGSPYNP